MNIMKRTFPPLAAVCAAAFLGMPGAARAETKLFDKQVGASIDFGQLVKGEMKDEEIEKQPISRTGVYLTVSGTHNERTEVRVSTGGLFWYPLPELNTPSRRVRFGPGVGRAQGIHTFGDLDDPTAKLFFGLAPHKYNPDATNLGEYLYRSGTYPGYLWTGGWSFLNSASYMSQGLRVNVPTMDGKVIHDFTFFMERDIAPTHNISPGYEITLKPTSFLEFGGGAVWSHALPLKDERTISPKARVNAYNTVTGLPLDLIDQSKPGYAQNDTMLLANPADPRVGTTNAEGRRYVTVEENGTPENLLDYYTFRGIKMMGRAAIDFGLLLDSEAIEPGQFKAYTEIALLGVENQPFYYEKRSERMPIMMGLNVPTFGLFDKLGVEVEYYKSRFPNQVGLLYDQGIPLPLRVGGDDPFAYSDSAVAVDPGKFRRDDWKWSVYARRKITDGLTLYAQAASDHLRHFDTEVKPANTPSTRYLSEWYYVVRVEFGLY